MFNPVNEIMVTDADYRFIRIASIIAEASKCVSKQLGAILVKDGRIISTGYNGTPTGHLNCNEQFPNGDCDEHHAWSLLNEIHAEQNALLIAGRNGISTNGAYIYITMSPCYDCVKSIIQAGIKRIYYLNEYKHSDMNWKSYAMDSGVAVIKIPEVY